MPFSKCKVLFLRMFLFHIFHKLIDFINFFIVCFKFSFIKISISSLLINWICSSWSFHTQIIWFLIFYNLTFNSILKSRCSAKTLFLLIINIWRIFFHIKLLWALLICLLARGLRSEIKLWSNLIKYFIFWMQIWFKT